MDSPASTTLYWNLIGFPQLVNQPNFRTKRDMVVNLWNNFALEILITKKIQVGIKFPNDGCCKRWAFLTRTNVIKWLLFRKQPSRGVPRKRCSENMQKIYRRKTHAQLLCNFIEIKLRHGCSPANLLHIFRTLFCKNTSGRLLLLFVPLHFTIKWTF